MRKALLASILLHVIAMLCVPTYSISLNQRAAEEKPKLPPNFYPTYIIESEEAIKESIINDPMFQNLQIEEANGEDTASKTESKGEKGTGLSYAGLTARWVLFAIGIGVALIFIVIAILYICQKNTEVPNGYIRPSAFTLKCPSRN